MSFAPEIVLALLTAVFASILALWLFETTRVRLGRWRASAFERPGSSWRKAVSLVAEANERRLPRRPLDLLERELIKAGRPLELRPAELVACSEACAVLFLGLGVAFARQAGLGPGTALAFLLLGAAFPLLWLRDKVKARHRAISRALPYDLDLLTLSVEAGLDFAAALAKVVEKGRKGPLASELAVTLRELKLGKTREEALRNLGRRAGLPALTSFVQALIQADRMGTSLGKVLRILSTQMRQERTQRAEKLANEAPVKLLIPLIGCIFPTIFLMLFGPIAYQVFFGGSF
jgi:tight adherence protein C